MDFDQIITILLASASISLGAFLGALHSKLVILDDKNNLHYITYSFSVLIFVFTCFCVIYLWAKFFSPNWFGIVIAFFTILSSSFLFWFTKKYIARKNTYMTDELDPIVNDFTLNADKNSISLFAGDLNFFGNIPCDMDQNEQYNCLKSTNFKNVYILCEEPKTNTNKIRYGKILYDMPKAVFKFYHPECSDLLIRGRLKKIQGVTKLLIYTKIKSRQYRAIETDTANSHGALYENIWVLLWTLAKKPSENQCEEYINLFKGHTN